MTEEKKVQTDLDQLLMQYDKDIEELHGIIESFQQRKQEIYRTKEKWGHLLLQVKENLSNETFQIFLQERQLTPDMAQRYMQFVIDKCKEQV